MWNHSCHFSSWSSHPSSSSQEPRICISIVYCLCQSKKGGFWNWQMEMLSICRSSRCHPKFFDMAPSVPISTEIMTTYVCHNFFNFDFFLTLIFCDVLQFFDFYYSQLLPCPLSTLVLFYCNLVYYEPRLYWFIFKCPEIFKHVHFFFQLYVPTKFSLLAHDSFYRCSSLIELMIIITRFFDMFQQVSEQIILSVHHLHSVPELTLNIWVTLWRKNGIDKKYHLENSDLKLLDIKFEKCLLLSVWNTATNIYSTYNANAEAITRVAFHVVGFHKQTRMNILVLSTR